MRCFIAVVAAIFLLPQAGWSNPVADAKADVTATQDMNAFALDLYAKLRTQDGNLFFSPESISLALAMTYAGAKGDTAKQMAQAMHFTLSPDKLDAALSSLLQQMNAKGKDRSYQLTLANALWVQKNFTLKSDFAARVQSQYDSGIVPLDFIRSAASARVIINDWVAKETAQKITNLIPQGMLDASTRLVLTNAIYFKGSWLTPFDKSATHDEDFQTASGSKHAVPMMHKTDDYRYYDGKTFQALELPYQGNDLSMLVLLPSAEQGLAGFEPSLTESNVEGWIGKLQTVPELQVTLPKFKMDAQFQLKDTLAAMGMKDAFDKSSADFSGIADITKEQNLYLSAVVHKAYVDVNEEGTEAAAATAVVGAVGAAYHKPTIFRADHPFIFLIRDDRSGSILFVGRITDPVQ